MGKSKVGSRAEGIIVLGVLRQKYLTRCQISSSKFYLYRIGLTESQVFQYSEGLIQIN